jgi:hypothetical protein
MLKTGALPLKPLCRRPYSLSVFAKDRLRTADKIEAVVSSPLFSQPLVNH